MFYSFIMPEEYHLKLDPLIKEIVKLYIKYEKSEIKKGKTVSSHLKPIVYESVNKMLEYLDAERKTNSEMAQDLKIPANQKILNLLDKKTRFR